MSSPPTVPRYTVADLERFPRDNRYELLDGVLLVTPLPSMWHQLVHFRLRRVLHDALQRTGLVEFGPGAVSPDERTWLEPDLLVAKVPPGPVDAHEWRDLREMPLAVEIAEPASRRYDVDAKAPAYLVLGVREAWVVDLDERTVQVFRPGEAPTTYEDAYDWQTGRDDVPVVHVDVRALFGGVAADGDAARD